MAIWKEALEHVSSHDIATICLGTNVSGGKLALPQAWRAVLPVAPFDLLYHPPRMRLSATMYDNLKHTTNIGLSLTQRAAHRLATPPPLLVRTVRDPSNCRTNTQHG